MTYALRFLPEVEEDVGMEAAWYEGRAPGLGQEFRRMFYACVAGIARNPLRYRKVYSEFRRCLLRRFPHAIYFRVENDQVVVFGLFHTARDPRAIQGSLGERGET